jgi:formylglycine-generating enzyme required for sulfatase activity
VNPPPLARGVAVLALLAGCSSSSNTAGPDPGPTGDTVLVPEGTFLLGGARSVWQDAFAIDRNEVTIDDFVLFLNGRGNEEEGGKLWFDHYANLEVAVEGDKYSVVDGYQGNPAVFVSWHGAQAYCEWTGSRLPTEEENGSSKLGLEVCWAQANLGTLATCGQSAKYRI